MVEFLRDLRHGLRTLFRSPLFASIATLTLAAGIGANTTIFSVVHAFLLRPLPFAEPQQLVHLFGVDRNVRGAGWDMQRFSAPEVVGLAEGARQLDALSAYSYKQVNVTGGDRPDRTHIAWVSDNLFTTLGVQPLLGNTSFAPEGSSRKQVVLSHAFWRSRFGADPAALGRPIRLDGEPFTVIGIMPPGFDFPFASIQMWALMSPLRQQYDCSCRELLALGRLAPGASLLRAQTELQTVTQRLGDLDPAGSGGRGIRVVPLREGLIFYFDRVRLMLATLMAAVGFVLLIVCANLANLQFVRAAARRQEVAVRTALGASRSRLVRQFFAESLVLSGAGAMLGVVLAAAGVRLLAARIPADLWRTGEIQVDGMALAFTLVASLAAALLFGLLPAFQGSRDFGGALRPGVAVVGESRQGGRLHAALVIAQISLAVVLSTGATLMVRNFVAMARDDGGLGQSRVLTGEVTLAASDYGSKEQIRAFFASALAEIGSQPGVQAIAAAYPLPFNHEATVREFAIVGRTAPGREKLTARIHWVSPSYFAVVGLDWFQGEPWNDRFISAATPVAVINQDLARRFWPAGGAVGSQLRWVKDYGSDEALTIMGVVADSHTADSAAGSSPHPEPQIYLPLVQEPRRRAFLLAQTATPPESMAGALRAAVARVDPALPVTAIRSLPAVVSEALMPWRLLSVLMALLAAGAVVLAACGIYGVMALSVVGRTREIGVRMALGARRWDVLRLVLQRGAALSVGGLALGVAGALSLERLLGGLLYGTSTHDAATFLASPLVLVLVAILASYLPARRATRIDPAVSLREPTG